MPNNMTHETLEQTLATLCGSYTLDIGDKVRAIALSLPSKSVCAVLPDLGDGVVRIVFDLDKPYALAHTRQMIQEWYESYSASVAFADGSVGLVQQPPSPRQPDGPVTLSLAV